jgi:hypothetical protein
MKVKLDHILGNKVDCLSELCVKYHVKRLELFGSAVDANNFDSNNSDLDFLVEFLPIQEGEYFDTYFDLLGELKDLFNRHIDLVTARSIRNKYFLQSINQNRTLLYAA